MSALETKEAANGEIPAEAKDPKPIKVSTGETHQPSQETMDRAEALKVEGNELLNGKG